MLKSRRLGMLFMPTCWLNVGRNKAIQARSARWRVRRVRAVCRKRLFSLTLEKPYSGLPAIVPTLRRGNAASDAPASRNAGALPDEFPRRSVGTIRIIGVQKHVFVLFYRS